MLRVSGYGSRGGGRAGGRGACVYVCVCVRACVRISQSSRLFNLRQSQFCIRRINKMDSLAILKRECVQRLF